MHSYVFLNLQSCSEQPLQQLQKKKKIIIIIKTQNRRKKFLSSFAHHHCRTCGHGSLYSVVTDIIIVCHHRSSQMTSIAIPSNVRQLPSNVHQHPSVRPLPSTNICSSPFILVNVSYSSNRILCYNFVTSVLYCYKILVHGTRPCPWMMRTLPLNQNQGISYKVTHYHLNRFL